MKRLLGACVLVAVAWSAVLVQGQTTPIFRANFAASAAPRYGFDSERTSYKGTAYTQGTAVGAGPNGTDALDITFRGVSSPNENYVGHYVNVNDNPTMGASRYVRMVIKIVSPVDARSVGNNGSWSSKMVILGDGGANSSNRMMWNLRTQTGTSQLWFVIDKNIDGINLRYGPLATDRWIYAQLKIQTGNGSSRFSLYIDNDNASESTPTVQSGTFTINPTGVWSELLGLGYYCDYMRSGGSLRYQFAKFEYDDEFDPNWRPSGGTPPGPTAPAAPLQTAVP